MSEIFPIKIQPLSADAMLAYGVMVEDQKLAFPRTEVGQVGLEKLRVKYRPNGNEIHQLAIHFTYNQTFIPLFGSLILVLAPAPRNRAEGESKGPDTYDLDYDRIAAFSLKPGQIACIDQGVWHNVVTLDQECEFVNVTRKNDGEGISPAEELEGNIDAAHAVRDYVEFVDIKKRDDRMLKLTL
tara:strand:+ start:104 stop:655 length:552 start_codon:yes stop_codon:yes gene_type:complete